MQAHAPAAVPYTAEQHRPHSPVAPPRVGSPGVSLPRVRSPGLGSLGVGNGASRSREPEPAGGGAARGRDAVLEAGRSRGEATWSRGRGEASSGGKARGAAGGGSPEGEHDVVIPKWVRSGGQPKLKVSSLSIRWTEV